ncbi:unnamed protein product [Effrenium voratum]|nr:unnamed protein product [Effrenium voratum]
MSDGEADIADVEPEVDARSEVREQSDASRVADLRRNSTITSCRPEGVVRQRTLAAVSLHESVPPNRWGVTYNDITFLKAEVKARIKRGSLGPVRPDEMKFGPSIYMVNDQYIKPITFEAGKMSWALMRNPTGLDSDLFISHAWEEGLFEFVEKVQSSWPRKARHAWCCMLANPQHLNIERMLETPQGSPFAVALESATYVLVVPNRQRSIYTRLWCGYEAYLAHNDNKIILIAHSSNRLSMTRVLCVMSACGALGMCLGGLIMKASPNHPKLKMEMSFFNLFMGFAVLAGALSLMCRNHWVRLVANGLGVASSTCALTSANAIEWPEHFVSSIGEEGKLVFWSGLVLFFILMEVDRVNSATIRCAGTELMRHYEGSITHAKCSLARDEDRIRSQINSHISEVDAAISVLTEAGMSTHALRQADAKGADIEDLAHSQIAVPVTILGSMGVLSGLRLRTELAQHKNIEMCVINGLALAARLLIMLQFCRSNVDDRCFMLKIISKLMLLVVLWLGVCVILGFASIVPNSAIGDYFQYVYDGSILLMAVFSLLGIQGTTDLPGGIFLLRLLLARGCLPSRRRYAPAETESESSESSDVECTTSPARRTPL